MNADAGGREQRSTIRESLEESLQDVRSLGEWLEQFKREYLKRSSDQEYLPGQREDFEFFPSSQERRELVRYCGVVAEYLHDQKIPNLVIRAGFIDVRVGTVNPQDFGASVRSDFYITRDIPSRGCYPFDQDRMVEKTFDHIYSKPTQDPAKHDRSIRLRKEIKQIVSNYLTENPLPPRRRNSY